MFVFFRILCDCLLGKRENESSCNNNDFYSSLRLLFSFPSVIKKEVFHSVAHEPKIQPTFLRIL